MQSEYFAFVDAAYAISALALLVLGLWIFLDARGRRAELLRLEELGVRRRSDRRTASDGGGA